MTPRRTYLLSINTLACSKAEIYCTACVWKYDPLQTCAESLKRDKTKTICLYMSDEQYYWILAS